MMMHDIRRQLRKLTQRPAREDSQSIALRPHDLENFERQPLPARLRAAAHQAEHAQLVRAALVSEQARRITQAWSDAIAVLPGALRSEAEQRFTALADAEQQLADKKRRLADLPSDGDEIWIQRRAQLTTGIDALEDLVADRAAACRQICHIGIPAQLDQALRTMEAVKAQELADAQLYFDDLQRRAKQELGRLKAERAAIGTTRAQANDPRAVEQHIGGRALSPDPQALDQAARERQRESRQQIAVALKAGRSL